MADIYELIERIQVTLASSNRPAKDLLNELHGELTDQIRRTNKRLRECDALLARGLRSEAIQLAEQEPPLLDLVAILDFPELPEWNDFVAELGLTVAPELQIEIAADVNQAYSDNSPLNDLMRKFRLSSLSREPLRARIGLLRKISSIDPGNPNWESDLKSYEEVRVRQIKEQFIAASHDEDFEELREISKELHGAWIVPPPKPLIQRVDQEVKALQQRAAQQRLAVLVDDLLDAYDDQDADRASDLHSEYEKLLKLCGSSDDVRHIQKQIRPALSWLSGQRKFMEDKSRFLEAVERLRRAIDSGHDLPELSRRFATVAGFEGFEVPEDVEEAYEIAILRHERKRRLRWVVIGSSIAAVLVITAIVFLIKQMTT